MADRIPAAELRLRGLLARTEDKATIDQLLADLRAQQQADALRDASTKLLAKYSVTCVTREAADSLRRMADQLTIEETDPS